MKLKEYIEENKEILYKIECFVNTKNVPDISDENTREFFSANDGFTETYANDMKLSQTLLEAEPVKVYLMDKTTYENVIYNDFRECHIPEGKKTLVALYSNSIIVPGVIE